MGCRENKVYEEGRRKDRWEEAGAEVERGA